MPAAAGRWQAVVGIVSTDRRPRRRLPLFATTLRTATDAAHRMHDRNPVRSTGACTQRRAPSEAAPGATAQGRRRRTGCVHDASAWQCWVGVRRCCSALRARDARRLGWWQVTVASLAAGLPRGGAGWYRHLSHRCAEEGHAQTAATPLGHTRRTLGGLAKTACLYCSPPCRSRPRSCLQAATPFPL